jgi:hypothetical protein
MKINPIKLFFGLKNFEIQYLNERNYNVENKVFLLPYY